MFRPILKGLEFSFVFQLFISRETSESVKSAQKQIWLKTRLLQESVRKSILLLSFTAVIWIIILKSKTHSTRKEYSFMQYKS